MFEYDIVIVLVVLGLLLFIIRIFGWIVYDFVLLSYICVCFDGVVKCIMVNIGDKVEKGDILVIIELNESLN